MASLNGSRSNSPSPPPDFDLDSTFPEISILIAHAEQYASELNLTVRNHPKSLFTATSWSFPEPFPEVKVPLRGHILCSPKSNGRVVGSKCNWKLVYKFNIPQMVYMWLPNSCIMKHDHAFTPVPVTLDGCTDKGYYPKNVRFKTFSELSRSCLTLPNLLMLFQKRHFRYQQMWSSPPKIAHRCPLFLFAPLFLLLAVLALWVSFTSFFYVNNPSNRWQKVTTKVWRHEVDPFLAKISLKVTFCAFFALVSRFC